MSSDLEAGTTSALSTSGSARHPVDTLYRDIAAVTGMPFPNLVYRRLGEDPARLSDCWSRVRQGLAAVGAANVRDRVLGPSLPAVGASGEVVPLEAGRAATLLTVLNAYDRGNACNAVVVRLLLRGGGDRPAAAPVLTSRAGSTTTDVELPPMLSLDSMEGSARHDVLRLAAILSPDGAVVPSLFRHLAHDPGLLATLASTLERAAADCSLHGASERVEDAVTATVACWPQPVQPVDDQAVRAVLAPFASVIQRMLAVSVILRSAYGQPSPGSPHSGQ